MNTLIKYLYKSILISLVFSGSMILAQNSNDALRLTIPGIISNARALGMGNSYATLGNDYASIMFNPAGLGLASKSEITGSLYYRYFENTATFFGNTNYHKNSYTGLNQFGLLLKTPATKGSLVFAFGYQKDKDFTSTISFDGYNPNNNSMIQDLTSYNDDVPFLLGLSYPLFEINDEYIKDTTNIEGRLNQSGTIYQEGYIDRYSFGTSIEAAENVFVGLSVNYLNGNYTGDREYYEEDVNNFYVVPTDPMDPKTAEFSAFYFNDILSWKMDAWEFRFGFLFNWLDFLSIGGSAKLATKFKIEENYYLDGYSEFGKNYSIELDPSNSGLKYEITTPSEFTLGASFNLSLLKVTGQATFIDYSQMEFSGDLIKDLISGNNKIIKENFRPVLNYNLGAELRIPFTQIRGRAGIMYLPSPYDNDPENFDRVYLTLGAGIIAGDALRFDVAYSYGFWDTYGDNYSTNQSRVFQKIETHTVLITTTLML
ncbi:MAG: hypothetical protein GXO85_13985 [Chlorobi bacterium]|nr:hypothetical protein [Chlorobiota bacterium]